MCVWFSPSLKEAEETPIPIPLHGAATIPKHCDMFLANVVWWRIIRYAEDDTQKIDVWNIFTPTIQLARWRLKTIFCGPRVYVTPLVAQRGEVKRSGEWYEGVPTQGRQSWF